MSVPLTGDVEGGARATPWWRWPVLLVCWAVSRGFLVWIVGHDVPFYRDSQSAFLDLEVYARWLPDLTAGRLPVDDMWQYPPASAFFFLLGAVGPEPTTSLVAAIVVVDLILTVVFARSSMRAGGLWVLFGLLVGPVLVTRFDIVPTLFAVLAVMSAGRPLAVGFWAAVGASAKVWPALVLPIVPPRAALRAGGAFLATVAVVATVSALVFEGLTGFLGGQGSRGLQVESVGALPFLVANAVSGGISLEYRYGAMEVTQAGAGPVAVVVSALAIAGFVWVAVAWWRGRLERSAPADVAFTVVLFSVVVSRVFSPQYSVWLLGLGVLCLVTGRLHGPVWLVAVAALVTQVIYPMGYGWLLAGDPVLVSLQVLRLALVVVAAGWSWYRVVIAPPG